MWCYRISDNRCSDSRYSFNTAASMLIKGKNQIKETIGAMKMFESHCFLIISTSSPVLWRHAWWIGRLVVREPVSLNSSIDWPFANRRDWEPGTAASERSASMKICTYILIWITMQIEIKVASQTATTLLHFGCLLAHLMHPEVHIVATPFSTGLTISQHYS